MSRTVQYRVPRCPGQYRNVQYRDVQVSSCPGTEMSRIRYQHYQLLTSPQQPNLRGTLKPKTVYKDCEATNIIERRLIKNSKGLKVPDCNTEQTKHSFFEETIVHWNQLSDKVVCALGCRNTTLAFSLTVYKSLFGILHVPETECIVSNYCSFNNNLFQTLKHILLYLFQNSVFKTHTLFDPPIG